MQIRSFERILTDVRLDMTLKEMQDFYRVCKNQGFQTHPGFINFEQDYGI